MPDTFDAAAIEHLAIALLGGLAVGIERQWSGKASGPKARFAGLRTFTLLGLTSGLCGWLWTAGLTGPAVIVLAGLGALVVVAYQSASRTDIDGTTEVSAFVVLTAGVLAGAGHQQLASAIIAITVLLLVEKRQLHGLVKRLDIVELRAGVRFAIMAAVVLPLLPEGPFGPLGGIRPRQLWELVLFFSGLSFVGYLARRAVGRGRGLAVAGLLGGMMSSTSVTLTYSRMSLDAKLPGVALAAGVMGANALMFVRVLIVTLALAPALAAAVWSKLVAPAVIGFAMFWIGLRQSKSSATDRDEDKNPLQVWSALQMAAVFQIVLFGVSFATQHFGERGLLGSAALLGLADVDALTLTMSRATSAATATAQAAATAVVVGTLVNTLTKLSMALFIGRGTYRWRVVLGLGAMAASLCVTLYFVGA